MAMKYRELHEEYADLLARETVLRQEMHGIPKGYLVTKKIAGKEYLYRTFVFLKQCAEMDALPMEKRKDALSFARAMTALEGLVARGNRAEPPALG